jgi:hypothetical protein
MAVTSKEWSTPSQISLGRCTGSEKRIYVPARDNDAPVGEGPLLRDLVVTPAGMVEARDNVDPASIGLT